MSMQIKPEQSYSYKDYLMWSVDENWELIHGIPYSMSPAPSRLHQKILRELFRRIADFLDTKSCEIYCAPFDVRFPEQGETDEEIDTVVQPDLSIIYDTSKLDDKGCIGAPDFIIEITSPGTAVKDIREKFYLYEQHGVQEYWIVHPVEQYIEAYILGADKKYGRHSVFTVNDKITPHIFKDLSIDLTSIFT